MIMPWEAKLEAMHMHKYEAICSFMMAEMCKSAFKKHKHKTAKSKPTSNKLKEEICFTLKMQYFLQ